MAKHCTPGISWAHLFVNRRLPAALLLAALGLPAGGCGSSGKRTVGLDVDVYLHPTSSESNDILLQAGIDKRLAENESTKNGIVHVRVAGGTVTLTGAVKNSTIKDAAERIARETVVSLNGTPIRPEQNIRNQIDIQP